MTERNDILEELQRKLLSQELKTLASILKAAKIREDMAKIKKITLAEKEKELLKQNTPKTLVFRFIKYNPYYPKDEKEISEYFTLTGNVFYKSAADINPITKNEMLRRYPDGTHSFRIGKDKSAFSEVLKRLETWKIGEPFEPVETEWICCGN